MSENLQDYYEEMKCKFPKCDVVPNALEKIESRLSALESQKDNMAHMFALQNDWNIASRLISERHSHRISALEHPTPPDTRGETDIQPSEAKAPDSTKTGEWIDLKKDDIEYWITWSDGDVTHEVLSHLLSISSSFEPIPTHVMLCKYVPGDSKPLPPEVK